MILARGAVRLPDQHRRRDQDPLLHAELRRLQPRRVSYTPTSRDSTAAPATAQHRRQEWRPTSAHGRENIVEGAAVYDGDFGGFGSWPRWSASIGDLKNDCRRRLRRRQAGAASRAVSRSTVGFKLAGSSAREVGDAKRTSSTAGIGYGFGPVNTSVNYGAGLRQRTATSPATGIGDAAYNVVFSADYRPGAGPGAGRRRRASSTTTARAN